MSTDIDDRERYVPDGEVDWAPFIVTAPLVIAAAVACGWLLNALHDFGHYYFLIFPALAGCLLSVVLYCIIRFSHCRSTTVAAGLGAVAGLVGIISMLYFGMLSAAGPGNAPSILHLPSYVHFRMMTQTITHGAPERPREPHPGEFLFSYFFMVMDTVIFALVPALQGMRFANHPYSAPTNIWYARSRFKIRSGVAHSAIASFLNGDLDEFAQMLAAGATKEKSLLFCTLYFVKTREQSPLAWPVYLSVDEKEIGGFSKGIFQDVRLSQEEAVALRPLFPTFEQSLKEFHDNLCDDQSAVVLDQPARNIPPNVPQQTAVEVIQKKPLLPPSQELAKITPQPEYPQVLTESNLTKIALRRTLPTLCLIFSSVTGMIGALFAGTSGMPLVCGLFLVLLTSGIVLKVMHVYWYARGWEGAAWAKLLYPAFRGRRDSLIESDETQAILVGSLNIEKSMRRSRNVLDDIGLLRVDAAGGVLLIDGDVSTYLIPLQAIKECKIILLSTEHPDSFLLDLMVRTEAGLRQLFLDVMNPELVACGKARQKDRVLALYSDILTAKAGQGRSS